MGIQLTVPGSQAATAAAEAMAQAAPGAASGPELIELRESMLDALKRQVRT